MSKAKKTQSEIANAIGVSQSTISRELSRNPVEGAYTHGRAFMRMYLQLFLVIDYYFLLLVICDMVAYFHCFNWLHVTSLVAFAERNS